MTCHFSSFHMDDWIVGHLSGILSRNSYLYNFAVVISDEIVKNQHFRSTLLGGMEGGRQAGMEGDREGGGHKRVLCVSF